MAGGHEIQEEEQTSVLRAANVLVHDLINFCTSIGYKEHTESSARNHRRQVPIPQADKNYKFWFFATQMRTLWLHVWQGRECAEDKYYQAQAPQRWVEFIKC